MSTDSFRVLVIGAGTGGLCLAQSLTRAGIDVGVYERDRTRTDGLFGFRVGISPDGSRALRACLPSELFATFRATTAITPPYFNMYTEQFSELISIGGYADATGRDRAEAEYSVSRMTLRQILLTGLEAVVHFDKKFTHYQTHSDATVTAYFADGTPATGDILVGADGSNSPVRRQYLPHATLIDSGLYGITAKLPLDDHSRTLLPPRVLRGVTMITAPRGDSTIIHVMEFRWDTNGELKQNIGGNDATLLAAWPGLNFDNSRDYIMLGFGSHGRYLPADFMRLDGPSLHALLCERTARWHPHLRELFHLVDASTCFPINIRTSVRIDPWPTTTVTLIGDAIHTMTPGLGVGANTALRDAQILSANLITAHQAGTPALDAIADYESQMHGYAWDLVAKSLERFDANSAVYGSGIGARLALARQRIGMRMVNHLPPVKRKMQAAMNADRDHGPNDVSTTEE